MINDKVSSDRSCVKKEGQKHIIITVTLRNFRYASQKNSCDIHNSIVWPTRLSRVARKGFPIRT